MTYWSVAAIFVSACFLIYRHPPSWLRNKSEENEDPRSVAQDSSKLVTLAKDVDTDSSNDSRIPAIVSIDSTSTPESGPSSGKSKWNAVDIKADIPTPTLRPPPIIPADASTIEKQSGGSLMPPPALPSVQQRTTSRTSSTALRIPTTGPLPQRGPPAHSQQRASGGLAAAGFVPAPNPRGKVLLAPGHSPMDWAALTRSGNFAGVPSLQRVTPSQLRAMTGRKGKPAWSSWQGKVYNITPYLPFHPGGEPELMKAAGRDGTKLFMDVHPWVNWENMLASCFVGVMVSEDFEKQSPLEAMD